MAALVLASVAVLPSVARADGRPQAGRAPTRSSARVARCSTRSATTRLVRSSPRARKQEPGAGTLLALALCHEGQGKTATAWAELNEAAALGKGVGRNDLAAAAQKRAPRWSRCSRGSSFACRRDAEDVDYDVKCDGEPVDAKQLGARRSRSIPASIASRCRRRARSRAATSFVSRGAGVVEIVVDKLDDAPRQRCRRADARADARAHRLDSPSPAARVDENRGGTQRIHRRSRSSASASSARNRRVLRRSRAQRVGRGPARPARRTPCPRRRERRQRARQSRRSTMAVTSVAAGTGAIALGAIIYLLAPSATLRGIRHEHARTATHHSRRSARPSSVGVTGAF